MGETLSRQWHAVMRIDEMSAELEGRVVAGHPVLLVNIDGDVLAYEDLCPHQGWPLHRGMLEDGELTCVNHLWVFNVSTGEGVNNPRDCSLVRYACQVDEDGTILVSFE